MGEYAKGREEEKAGLVTRFHCMGGHQPVVFISHQPWCTGIIGAMINLQVRDISPTITRTSGRLLRDHNDLRQAYSEGVSFRKRVANWGRQGGGACVREVAMSKLLGIEGRQRYCKHCQLVAVLQHSGDVYSE